MQRDNRIRPRKISACLSYGTALLLAVALARNAHSQSLPPSAPTHPVTAPPPQAPFSPQPATSAPVTPARQPAGRAHVELVNGQLAIKAENSSLDQILGEIARLNGMKINGGVSDERVFGTYGPGPQQEVLAQLLDGTGSNVLILQNSTHGVSELVLSPRNGGPTPPSPNLIRAEERPDYDRPPEPGRRFGRPDFPDRRQFGSQRPPEASPSPLNPAGQPIPEAGNTTQQSPNGVKTPQQIAEEQLRAQQMQQQATPNPQ